MILTRFLKRATSHIDWVLFLSILPILGAGLVTMNSFSGNSAYFEHQLVWIPVSIIVFFVVSSFDMSFLRRSNVVVALFLISCASLLLLIILGTTAKGAQSWFNFFGLFSIEPSEFIQIALVLVLAKYFSRRHIEIRNIRHIVVSGAYSLILFLMILIQPDFGSAIIIFLIWFGMVLVSGISKRHILTVVLIGALSFAGLWIYVFKDYQKARIMTFLNPLTDIHGAGYNANQSMIAVGSGEVFGKGIGYGTQSKLNFLPEYQTDFIFAAFAEEWGFIGVILLFFLYGIVTWRILLHAVHGATNFEVLYGIGLAIVFMAHFIINVGMNIGLMPVTGVTIPFMSYGGSHLVTEMAGLGILMGMRRYQRPVHRDRMKNEFIGI